MKRKIKKWHIAGGFAALVLIALAQLAAGDWWAIHYAKYLAGVDNAYVNEAGQICFTTNSKNAATPSKDPGSKLAGPLAHH